MGIRFKCHHCEAALNIKEELALKRGICPTCKSKFRIPESSCDYSLPVDGEQSRARPSVPSATTAKHRLLHDKPGKKDTASVLASSSSNALKKGAPTLSKHAKASPKPPAPAKPLTTVDADQSKAQEPLHEIESQYFVRPPSGGEYGPASKSTIEEWITQRRVTADTLVCKLGSSEWAKAKDVFVMKFLFP